MTARPWTAAEQRDLVRYYQGGMKLQRIADALGRSGSAIESQLRAMHLARTRCVWRLHDQVDAARTTLRAECAAARAERVTAAPYRNGPLQW
jgi:hypothetical protein